MADAQQFLVLDASNVPLIGGAAGMTILAREVTGAIRTPPTITEIGDGVYQIQPTDADEVAGTVFLIDTGGNNNPRRFTVTAFKGDNTNQFWAFTVEDTSGALWTGTSPTIGSYRGKDGLTRTPQPAFVPVYGQSVWVLIPSVADVVADTEVRVDGPPGSAQPFWTGSTLPYTGAVVDPTTPAAGQGVDYTDTKQGPGIAPENAIASDYGRLEPVIGPEELQGRFLFGLPLVSQLKDPFTNKPQVMTPDMLKDYIDGAMQNAEAELNIDIRPVVRKEKYPFDRNLYESYGYFMLEHRPVSNLAHIAVAPANGTEVYSIPLEWVEVANMVRGQINIIPMTAAFIQGGTVPAGTTGASYFLAVLGNRFWVPAYWQITYTSGFPDGLVPRTVNDLIGTMAAMEILSMLAVTFARTNSHSLGLDGLSQSISTPGPNLFAVRLQELEKKKAMLVKKIKSSAGRKVFATYV